MKALIAAAVLAVAPVASYAAPLDIETDGTLSAKILADSTATFTLTKSLINVLADVGYSGGVGSYTVTGIDSSLSAAYLAAGSVITFTFSNPTYAFTGYTVSVWGDLAPVPVPAAGLLAMGGIAALGAVRARRKKA